MNVKNIIYYTCDNDIKKTLSIRNLCLKAEYDHGLETIFFAVRDALDTKDLLSVFQQICHEKINFDSETDSYILFKVIDAYDNTNYLKFRKSKNKQFDEI